MKKFIFLILITFCLVLPSAITASNPRKTVMPIEIIIENTDGSELAKSLETDLYKQFAASSKKYHITSSSSSDETRLQIRLNLYSYRPRAISFKGYGAMASMVNMASLVWTVKQKGIHPYYFYHTIIIYESSKDAAMNIVETTDGVINMIYKYYPKAFNFN